MPDRPSLSSRVRGCLLGGAVGDALGAPVEFLSLSQIRSRYGSHGLQTFDMAYGRKGALTDDTQMTLFTAEGLLRALVRLRERGICNPTSVVYQAYLRWLHTQGERLDGSFFDELQDGWLVHVEGLHARRAPGNTCLSALRSGEMGTPDHRLNDSKGCGGVMRVAPVGLLAMPERAFELGCEVAAITHSHPSGYLAAGVLACMIAHVRHGASLRKAIQVASTELRRYDGHDECLRALEAAVHATEEPVSAEALERLGEGWVAEEALAMSVYCALAHPRDVAAALRLAVNHSGDSDSTGAITGNLQGALLGEEALPGAWLEALELRDVIEALADDVAAAAQGEEMPWDRYPGW